MKVGLIARSEDRGLGNLTWEWAQHMRPDRVLLVVPRHAIPQRPERYAEHDVTVVQWNPEAPALDAAGEAQVRKWLGGLDVVYSAETFYDWRICTWARAAGARTVCHVMPEFYRHGQPDAPPGPDVWWAPTGWRLEHLDPQTRVVPVPVATERFRRARRTPPSPEPVTWLHPAGTRAAADRNGSRLFLTALRHLREPHRVIVKAQSGRWDGLRAARSVDVVTGHAAGEYWQLFDGADGVVLPRRYGGLSLPAQEAMAAGCALLMTDVEPQRSEWPIVRLAAAAGKPTSIRTSAGSIPVVGTDPRTIAAAMDELARDRAALRAARRAALEWAQAHSWETLRPTIDAELARAAG